MSPRPLDTSPEAWSVQLDTVRRLSGEARLRVALDLSDAVRAIRLAGLREREPGMTDADAVRALVARDYGIDLPTRR